MAFTYQNLDGKGWLAIGRALAAVGIRPVQAWPMFGDSGSSPQKRPTSISWDCVMFCTFGHAETDLVVDDAACQQGVEFAKAWQSRLRQSGYALTDGDVTNLVHAGAVLEATRPDEDRPLNPWETRRGLESMVVAGT